MSARKYSNVATIAPNWMIAVNAVTAGSSTGSPSSSSAMVRCPVLETGRNSVSPSTTPSRTASTYPSAAHAASPAALERLGATVAQRRPAAPACAGANGVIVSGA